MAALLATFALHRPNGVDAPASSHPHHGFFGLSPLAASPQESKAGTARRVRPKEVKVPDGYRVEMVAQALNYPVDIAFGDQGEMYVAEAGLHSFGSGDRRVAWPARILRIGKDRSDVRIIYTENVSPTETIRHESSKTDGNGTWLLAFTDR